jgi:hypothetical protein
MFRIIMISLSNPLYLNEFMSPHKIEREEDP